MYQAFVSISICWEKNDCWLPRDNKDIHNINRGWIVYLPHSETVLDA